MSFGSFLKKAKDGLKDVKQGLQDLDKVKENLGKMSISDVGKIFGGDDKHSHTHDGVECHEGASHGEYGANRYSSFAPETTGRAKWYVDGASYFWALSMALEEAREYIYILDWWLSPELYLRRPPSRNNRYRLDHMLKAAAERGVKVYVIVYKEVPQALTLNSDHTKKALRALHPNIFVFRHPDHHPGNDVVTGLQDFHKSLMNFSFKNFNLAKASEDVLKGLYGTADDVVLYWAHHEKLCLIDGKIAFMGGLDLCFGRWDTISHPIADAHPGNVDDIIFPGQDYNNARVFDFENVDKWEQNKLDRSRFSRMGWSDIALSLTGPIVESLETHFVQRWNFIFNKKYSTKDPGKYERLEVRSHQRQSHHGHGHGHGMAYTAQSFLDEGTEYLRNEMHQRFSRLSHHFFGEEEHGRPRRSYEGPRGQQIQLTRSACNWSLGVKTEHSIANAYIDAIKNARYHIYIENQFFITATSDKQKPVTNKIGKAIVDRILRAHQYNEPFHIVVIMPAVPAFAGDLKSDGALGTRAIMEFQYFSINRGGYSILETLQKAGVEDPSRYITFYNLRSFDRINTNTPGDSQYRRYNYAASQLSHYSWDSIAACYMDNGPDLNAIPWTGPPEKEMDAYVSEQLYIHSKLLIADDSLVICGSANLNDRSQLGNHDSEIAVVITDANPSLDTTMAGYPHRASHFAASLRRFVFRKHLGLLPHQPVDQPDRNWTPVTHDPVNEYDWGSDADCLVADPLSPRFMDLWRTTARRNTEIFSRAFHPVPDDKVRTWKDYEEFFSKYFVNPGESAEKQAEGYKQGKVDYGHVVKEEFPGGVEELKAWLSGVRGTLVEMPLGFLADEEDIAKEGLALNSLTQELYT